MKDPPEGNTKKGNTAVATYYTLNVERMYEMRSIFICSGYVISIKRNPSGGCLTMFGMTLNVKQIYIFVILSQH